ncbi:hypothetical protein KEM56_002807, partial [Ascosphaera pollenicola]
MQQESIFLPLRPLSRKEEALSKTEPETASDTEQTDLTAPGQQQEQQQEEQQPKPENETTIRVRQINEQRGSFRSVTESQLREEIEAAKLKKRNGEDNAEEDDSANASALSNDRMKQLQIGRDQMLLFTSQAYDEVIVALDFVSLILAKFSSSPAVRQADSTISAFRRGKFPIGSIDVDYASLLPEDEHTRKTAQEISVVSQGWKSASFAAASKKLRSAAARIDKETEAENAYWKEILRIKMSGWQVMRNPIDKRVLAVQCASLEAGRVYKERGLTSLRRSSEGKVILDQGLDTNEPKGLRVRIERRGRTVGRSDPKCLDCLKRFTQNITEDDLETDEAIRLRRDTLFEEELWQELQRESKRMLSYGLEMNRGQVRFPTGRGQISDQEYVVIDLAGVSDLEGDSVADNEGMDAIEDSTPLEETVLAHAISLSLRLLFSHAQRSDYEKRRMELPRPLAEKRRPDPEYRLLRPVLNHIRHKAKYTHIMTALEGIGQTMKNAGLEWKLQANPPLSLLHRQSRQTKSPSDVMTPDIVMSPLLKPVTSSISISCRSRTLITITLQTSFDFASSTSRMPHLGVRFYLHSREETSEVRQSDSTAKSLSRRRNSLRSSFTSQKDLLNEVQFLIQGDLVNAASEYSSSQREGLAPPNDDGSEEDLDNESDVDFEFEREAAAFPELNSLRNNPHDSRLQFVPFFRETGELSAFSRRRDQSKRLFVSLDIHEAKMQVESYWSLGDATLAEWNENTSLRNKGIGEVVNYVWSRDNKANNSAKTFEEVIKHLSLDLAEIAALDIDCL